MWQRIRFFLVSVVERHVLAILRRTEGDAPAKVTVGRIAHATGMSERRALFVLEGLEERRLLEIEPDALTEAAAVITESGRVALARAGGWPPRWP